MHSADEVDNWIRKCAYDVGFTKSNVFIGQTMFIQNFIRSLGAILTPMIKEGLITDMLEESSRRIAKGEEGGKAEGKAGEVVALTPRSIPKPKEKASDIPTESETEDPSTAQHFNFSKINIDIPTVDTEAPIHTFRFQHQVLSAAQSNLETLCYKFSEKNYPSILSRNNWKYPEAGELTAWTKELIQSFEADPKPVVASIYSPTKFPQVLKDLTELRHTTVHRIQIPSEKFSDLLKRAFTAAKMFKDDQGINNIALLFHGQSDCLELAQEAKKEKVELESCMKGSLECLEEGLEDLEERANELWGETLVVLESISSRQKKIDKAYEDVLESQLSWMCGGGSRKSYALISKEFQVQLPGRPEPTSLLFGGFEEAAREYPESEPETDNDGW